MIKNNLEEQEAVFYKQTADGKIACLLCPQGCVIAPERSGFCRVRTHRDAKLFTNNFARISSIGLDPIEKKPLYHYYPGKPILSIGTVGCNLACEFCQNWQISKEDSAPTQIITPDELAGLAVKFHRESSSIGVAYTYSEPGVWIEFLQASMPLIREKGLKNVLVTNAFLNSGPWRELIKWTDAANIDLKGFDTGYYRRLCHGKLEPVLDNIKAAAGKIHLELTTLLIPGENDQPEQIEAMAKWIADIDPMIPLHLSRYFPNYHLTKPATPAVTMEKAYEVAKTYLHYVYLGNIGHANDTTCHKCGRVLIKRNGYQTELLADKECPKCKEKTNIIIEED